MMLLSLAALLLFQEMIRNGAPTCNSETAKLDSTCQDPPHRDWVHLPGTYATQPVEERQQFVQRVYRSVVLLYKQGESGDMKMICTATAYRKIDNGYRLASASHCVEGKKTERKLAKYFMTLDSAGEKTFIPAKLIDVGNKKDGDDFSIFEVQTKESIGVVELGDNSTLVMGDKVMNIAAPLGLGKQYFSGYVTITALDRPPVDAGDVQWSNVMVVDIGAGPGSSGSAIVSEDQRAIVGFLVGHTVAASIGALVVPVSKFKAFETAVDKGTYKHPKEDDE